MPQILVTCLVFTVVQSQPGLTGPTGLCVRCWSRLWFMLWLSVRWRITSEFSWASVECDRLWPALHRAAAFILLTEHFFCLRKIFLFLTSRSSWIHRFTPVTFFPPSFWLFWANVHFFSETGHFFHICVTRSRFAAAAEIQQIRSNNRTAMGAEIVSPLHDSCRCVCVCVCAGPLMGTGSTSHLLISLFDAAMPKRLVMTRSPPDYYLQFLHTHTLAHLSSETSHFTASNPNYDNNMIIIKMRRRKRSESFGQNLSDAATNWISDIFTGKSVHLENKKKSRFI